MVSIGHRAQSARHGQQHQMLFPFPNLKSKQSDQTTRFEVESRIGGRATFPRSTVGSMDQIPPAGTVAFADDDTRNRGRRIAATAAPKRRANGSDKLGTLSQIHGELYLFLASEPAESNALVSTLLVEGRDDDGDASVGRSP